MFTMLRAVLLIALFILKGAILLSRWIFRMAVRGVCRLRRKLIHEDLRSRRFKLVSDLRNEEIRRARESRRNARSSLIKGNLPAAVEWRRKQRAHVRAAQGYGCWLRNPKAAA